MRIEYAVTQAPLEVRVNDAISGEECLTDNPTVASDFIDPELLRHLDGCDCAVWQVQLVCGPYEITVNSEDTIKVKEL
jgi:hypothetical protein